MSLTVFFGLCILSIDFMIYFFFKLVYGEKRGSKPRRLPPEYYGDDFSRGLSRKSSSAHFVPARKSRRTYTKNVLSMPPRKPPLSGATTGRNNKMSPLHR